MGNSDYEGGEDEESKLPAEIFECFQETSLKDIPLMAAEISSLVEGDEINTRAIESIHRIFAECLYEDNLRANLNEEIDTVSEEVLCIVEIRGFVTSRDEEESF